MRALLFSVVFFGAVSAYASPLEADTNDCPQPPEYVMMSCLEQAHSIEQGFLVADDGVTKIGVLRLTGAPEQCRTNMLSHPFVIDAIRSGRIQDSLWFNSQSVDALLKGDAWRQRANVVDVAEGDVFLHRTHGDVDSVGLVKSVGQRTTPNSVWIVFEFKTDGAPEKTGSILVERANPDEFEVWTKQQQ